MEARTAVIVAGGRGTRLQPLTHGLPKPLVEFCGAPFLVGVLRRLADAGVTRVLLVVGADTTPFDGLVATGPALGLEIVAVEEPSPLDTAGGVRAALHLLDGPTLVCNGDILTDVPFAEVAGAHVASGADATLVLTRVDDTSSFGVCVRDGDRITAFVEKPAPGTLPGQDTVNAGTYVLDPAVLAAHPEGRLSFERQVFPDLLSRGGHVAGFVWDGAWADLGTPERLRAGHRLALDGACAWPSVDEVAATSGGVRVAEGARTDGALLTGPVLVLEGAVVAAGARVGPHVVVGREAHVGPDARVRDSVLASATRIGAGVRAEGLCTGPGATLGAGAVVVGDAVVGADEHVAPGTTLPVGARVPAPRG